jgi:hypothetical protein
METQVTLKITLEEAKKLYPTSPEELKKIFMATFGISHFVTNPKEVIKSFEDACKFCHKDPNADEYQYNMNADTIDISVVAYKRLAIIARAINTIRNGGTRWEPNYTDANEYKYYPWFKYQSGVGFSYPGCGYSRTDTSVGSRLVFKTSEDAIYAGTQFISDYNKYLISK